MPFIVTGASSGIGFAAARSLAKRDIDVIAVARSVDRLVALGNSCGNRVHIVPADLSTESGRFSVVEKARAFGKVDGIVHAAGSRVAPVAYGSLNSDAILADLNIHVTVPISMNNALNDELAGGRILYIDSYSANKPRIGWSGYSIVKAAAQMAAQSAAAEIIGSRVIRVFPGAVRTPLVETLLTTSQSSPTVSMFKEMASSGTISEPDVVGKFITDILITATDQQLDARGTWDFNRPEDRIFQA